MSGKAVAFLVGAVGVGALVWYLAKGRKPKGATSKGAEAKGAPAAAGGSKLDPSLQAQLSFLSRLKTAQAATNAAWAQQQMQMQASPAVTTAPTTSATDPYAELDRLAAPTPYQTQASTAMPQVPVSQPALGASPNIYIQAAIDNLVAWMRYIPTGNWIKTNWQAQAPAPQQVLATDPNAAAIVRNNYTRAINWRNMVAPKSFDPIPPVPALPAGFPG